MALSFRNQPADVQMCRSSMIYIGYSDVNDITLSPKPNFPYTLEIHVWQGSLGTMPSGTDGVYTIKAYPDQYGNGVFNINRIVMGHFIDIHYNLPVETSGNLAVNVRCKLTCLTDSTKLWTNTIQAHYGFNKYTDNINLVIPQVNDGFLTDLPDQLYISKEAGYMVLFTRHTDSSAAGGYMIKTDGGATDSNFFTTPMPPTSSEQTILVMQVGYQSLDAAIQADITDWYDVVLIDRASVPVGKPIRFNIKEACKNPLFKIDWINRYGVWDRLFLFGNSQETLEVSKQSGMRYVAPTLTGGTIPNDTWKQGVGQYINFSKEGGQMFTVNTGWLSESYNEAIAQLYMAERIVFDGHAVTLEDKSFVEKRDRTEKVVNYTFKLKSSFSYANTVG